jgi:hypothetical protein
MKTSALILKALLLIASLSLHGQHLDHSAYFSSVSRSPELPRLADISDVAVMENGISASLLSMFPYARNPIWSVVDDYQKVFFEAGGLITKAFFGNDGRFSYSLTNYPTERLPEEILRNVYQTYKKYKIINAQEIKTETKTRFYINLENRKSFRSIEVMDNKIVQVKRLRKAYNDAELD